MKNISFLSTEYSQNLSNSQTLFCLWYFALWKKRKKTLLADSRFVASFWKCYNYHKFSVFVQHCRSLLGKRVKNEKLNINTNRESKSKRDALSVCEWFCAKCKFVFKALYIPCFSFFTNINVSMWYESWLGSESVKISSVSNTLSGTTLITHTWTYNQVRSFIWISFSVWVFDAIVSDKESIHSFSVNLVVYWFSITVPVRYIRLNRYFDRHNYRCLISHTSFRVPVWPAWLTGW